MAENINKKRFLSSHNWYAKVKPYTEYRKENYETLLQIHVWSFKSKSTIFVGSFYQSLTIEYQIYDTTYLWLQSNLCLTKVFDGSADQFKDRSTISKTY